MQTCDLLIKDGSLLIKYDQLEEHVDMAVSGLALIRSSEREKGIPATSSWQQEMDEHYGDDVLKKIYPNALKVD